MYTYAARFSNRKYRFSSSEKLDRLEADGNPLDIKILL